MNSTRTMSTGLLVFSGAPKVTPLVSILFAPFHLSPRGGEGREHDTRRIHVTAACPPVWWHVMAKELLDYAGALRVPHERDASAGELLCAIARHFGGGDVPGLVRGVDFGEPVQAADLALLCRAIPDGNNVEGVLEMGSYQGDRAWPWEAGGWIRLDSPRLGIELRTFSLLNYFDALDRALAARDTQGAAAVVSELAEVILDGIADPLQAQQVREILLGRLQGANAGAPERETQI